MKSTPPMKLFVVRKYIKAISAADAIRRDKTTPVDDVWVDDDWKKGGNMPDAIGFIVPAPPPVE
jgi:hypothetical protein